MHYLIDGYNLLFRLLESKKTLESQRHIVIGSLQKEFKLLHLKGTIVFDGRHRFGEQSGLAYRSPLVIAYSHGGQTADQYILDTIEAARQPSEITMVTDDRFLATAARGLGAQTLKLQEFVRFLEHKRARRQLKKNEQLDERPFKETKKNKERLLKEFEARLEENPNQKIPKFPKPPEPFEHG